MGGHPITGETRRKISERLRGHSVSEETRRKISQANTGHSVSPEAKQQMSEKHKGQHHSPRTEFKKGLIPWNKGQPMASEAKAKMIAKKKGMLSWNKGIPMNEWMPEESNKVRKAKIKENNPRYWLGKKRLDMIERWKDPTYREEMVKRLRKASFTRPTKPEQRIIDITQEYNLPYQYTGDGLVILFGLNPDFMNSNGAKKIIEIFGVAFHDPSITFRAEVPLIQQEEYRKAIFASLGFDCLVLWDKEMERLSDEEIAQRIRRFTKARKKPSPQLQLKELG